MQAATQDRRVIADHLARGVLSEILQESGSMPGDLFAPVACDTIERDGYDSP